MPKFLTVFILIAFWANFTNKGFGQLSISKISPLIVERFDTVTITGNSLAGITEVFFGIQRAKSFTAINDTLLKAVINHGAAGKVKVKTSNAEALSSESILVSYNSDLLFVGSFNEDSLNIVHPEDGKVIGKIRLPRTVEYFCILPNNKLGYASDPVKDSLYEISLTEWRVLRQIKVDDIGAIEYNPVDSNLLVTSTSSSPIKYLKINGINLWDLSSQYEFYFDATNLFNFSEGVTLDKIHFSSYDSVLWFGRNSTNLRTFLFSTKIGANRPYIKLVIQQDYLNSNPSSIYGIGTFRDSIFALRNAREYGTSGYWVNDLSQIDLNGKLTGHGKFQIFGNGVTLFAQSNKYRQLYCGDYVSNKFYIMDPHGPIKLRKSIDVGKMPTQIGVSPVLDFAYTLNRLDSSITLIDLKNEVIKKTFKPGFQPKNYEGPFVANYNAKYIRPEILSLSENIARPGDTIFVYGKNIKYIDSIKIGESFIKWFKAKNDSVLHMVIPATNSGLLTFISTNETVPYDTFRVCHTSGTIEQNGYFSQNMCPGEPFTFFISKNSVSEPHSIKWQINSQIYEEGPYFTRSFSNDDTIRAILSIDSGNCSGYKFYSNKSIIQLAHDSLNFISIPTNGYFGTEHNTKNKSFIPNFKWPNYEGNSILSFASAIDTLNNLIYYLGAHTDSGKQLVKYNYRTRKIESQFQIRNASDNIKNSIVLGKDGKYLFYCQGQFINVIRTDSIGIFKSINLPSGNFNELIFEGHHLKVSKVDPDTSQFKMRYAIIDTSLLQVTSYYLTDSSTVLLGYSNNKSYRYESSENQFVERPISADEDTSIFKPGIYTISFKRNCNRYIVYSDYRIAMNLNSGIFNFENKTGKKFPYLIFDAVSLANGNIAVIAGDNSKTYLKIIDGKDFSTRDSTLVNLDYSEIGTPFMQSYTLTRPPCSNKIKLCNGLPNAGMVIEKMEGTNYQWQVSTDKGNTFTNIENGPNYTGTNTRQLNLANLPDSLAGYLYRCIVDSKTGESYQLTFENTWKPMQTGNWEDPSNWSCGIIPGPTTDVIIFSGSVKINSDITVKSLHIMPGVHFKIEPGKKITLNKNGD